MCGSFASDRTSSSCALSGHNIRGGGVGQLRRCMSEAADARNRWFACRILCPMNDRHDKDARLAEDIRLLGRLLGETIRAYEGEAEFTQIEEIRRLAVASRRQEDTASRDALARTLDALTTDQAVAVVRAFSFFSLLANIAEDRHHIRRSREIRREGGRPLPSTVRGLVVEAQERGTTAR